ncbi:MAG: hypothetical protein ABR506_00835, partial [Candidatus Krumholzibacteriia bacterium]
AVSTASIEVNGGLGDDDIMVGSSADVTAATPLDQLANAAAQPGATLDTIYGALTAADTATTPQRRTICP